MARFLRPRENRDRCGRGGLSGYCHLTIYPGQIAVKFVLEAQDVKKRLQKKYQHEAAERTKGGPAIAAGPADAGLELFRAGRYREAIAAAPGKD